MGNDQKKLVKFEIVKNEPYKFIGKSVYLGNKKGWLYSQNS